MHKSLRQEHELLQMQAETLRLKLVVNQVRRQQQARPDLLELASKLPQAGLVWRLANMPRKLKYKLLLGGALLAVIYLRS
ncbi:hypothetical protein [Zobellella maritima]|uniref:hypothetical protein n=1 Tax=Zobellella maritima TaxID=2059725 RepID=UPI000E3069DF|nr:hypothetical protein [Zobellella maritima]